MEVTVMGRIGYDLYALEHGVDLKDVTRFERYLGGSSANMAVGLSRLGAKVRIISCLGTDALAGYLVEYLKKEGVDTSCVQQKPGLLASLCLTEVSPPSRFPQVFYRERAADTQIEIGEMEKAAICQSKLFVTNGTSLCASPSRESTFSAMECARQNGVRVAFDVDYRDMSWDSPSQAGLYARLALPFIDVFIANPEEICLVAENDDVESATESLQRHGVPIVVAKLGSKGTRIVTREKTVFLPPYPIEVVSTIGAGDAFASGFLYATLRGMPLEKAIQFGNAAASIVVSRVMCSEAMPYLEEVEALIKKHPDLGNGG